MFNFVIILAVLGSISLLVFLLALVMRIVALVQSHKTDEKWKLNTSLVRRSLIMAIIWCGCSAGINWLMRTNPKFVDQVPSVFLHGDICGSAYAKPALESLIRRATNMDIDQSDAQDITDTLLATDWWVKATQIKAFDDNRPVQNWLALNIERGWLTTPQLTKWLTIVPPPIFMVNADRKGRDPNLIILIQFGRDWQRETKAPYRVNAIKVDKVTLDGKSADFKMVEQPGSHSEIGWYSSVVSYSLEGIRVPTDLPNGHCEVVIHYTLDIEPNSYQKVGPLTFTQSVVVSR